MEHPRLPTPGRDVVVGPATSGGYPSYHESPGYAQGFVDDPGSGGLAEVFRILRRRKGTLILTALFGLLAAVLLTLPQTPVYQARTSLEIQDLNENFLNMKQVSPVSEGNSYTALTDIQTQIKLLESESLAKRVLAKLKARTSGPPRSRVRGNPMGRSTLRSVPAALMPGAEPSTCLSRNSQMSSIQAWPAAI